MTTEPENPSFTETPFSSQAEKDTLESGTTASPAEPTSLSEGGGLPNLAPEQLKFLEAEILQWKDRAMRALADAENTRRRSVKEREDAGKYAVSSFARDLLDFSDNFHRALDAIPTELHQDERIAGIITGLKAMDTSLLKTFDRHGIRKIEPLDQPFDPNFHEVMFEAPIPGKAGGLVIQVVEAGYVLNDRLLRAAKVGISKSEDSGAPSHRVNQQA